MPRTRTRNNIAESRPSALMFKCTNPNPFNVVIVTSPTGSTATVGPGVSYPIVPTDFSNGINSTLMGSSGTITDESPFPSRRSYNEVNNTKMTLSFRDVYINEEWMHPSRRASDNTTAAPVKLLLAGHQSSGDGFAKAPFTVPTLDSVSIMRTWAQQNMRLGEIKPSVDLPLFIAELKDFKDVWEHTGMNLLGLMDKRKGFFTRRTQKGFAGIEIPVRGQRGASTPVQLVDAMVSIDLSWKLAISPFIEGFNKLRKMKEHLRKTYERAMNPRPERKRASMTRVAYGPISGSHWSSVNAWVETQIIGQRKVSVWALVRFQPTAISAMQSVQATYVLTPRVSTAWELIPLSFILDEFIDIGRWLRQFDGGILNLPYQVLQSGYSVKDTATRVRTVYPFTNSSKQALWGRPRDFPISGNTERITYQRLRAPLLDIGSAIQPLQVGLPNFGQVGTIAEILYARLRGYHDRNV